MSDHAHSNDSHHEGESHACPMWILLATFGALLFLTVVTVAVSVAQLGDIALLVAMIIAAIKASIVCLFFMHLWWDSRFNGMALVAAFLFVALFIGLAVFDTGQYAPHIKKHEEKKSSSLMISAGDQLPA